MKDRYDNWMIEDPHAAELAIDNKLEEFYEEKFEELTELPPHDTITDINEFIEEYCINNVKATHIPTGKVGELIQSTKTVSSVRFEGKYISEYVNKQITGS